MQEAIKRAIEGGYTSETTLWVTELGGLKNLVHPADILLDPEFWRSLGKAENWIEYMGDGTPYLTYQRYWKELIDHLAEGKDIESYFKELLN